MTGIVRLATYAVIVWIFSTANSAFAQSFPFSDVTRFDFGISFTASDPKGDFGRNVGTGVGAGGSLLYHLDRSGWLSLRFDGSGLEYGSEKKRVPISQTIGARILTNVTTTNWMAGMDIGPEFMIPKGRVRPYVNAAFSGLFFRTTSSLENLDHNGEDIGSTTNYKDNTRALVYGAGFRIPFSNASFLPMLDFGVHYHRGGSASYLREGSIQDNPDGSITIDPLRSRTPYMTYSIGMRFRIPHDSRHSCSRFIC